MRIFRRRTLHSENTIQSHRHHLYDNQPNPLTTTAEYTKLHDPSNTSLAGHLDPTGYS